MTVRLHPRQLAGLVPREGRRTEYHDEVVPCLTLRVSATARTYYVLYRTGGRRRRYRLGLVGQLELADARAAARAVLARVAVGDDPAAERVASRQQPRTLTLTQLGDRCLAALELRPSTRASWTRLWERHVRPVLGGRAVGAVTRADVRQLLASIAAPYVANRTFELLRRIYNWGYEQDLVRESPCSGLRKPHRERASERVLSTAELRALLRALDRLAPNPYVDAVWLLLLTCVRERNVLEARADQFAGLDGDAPLWTIDAGQMKAARSHVVPLVGAAAVLFSRWAERAAARGTPYLFPNRFDASRAATWSTRFRASLRAEVAHQAGATVARWTIHNLRHTVATRMREDLRVSSDVVDLLLAHRRGERGASLVYDRAQLLPERRAALVAWAAHLEGLRGDTPGRGVVLPLNRPDPRPAPTPVESNERAEQPALRSVRDR